VRTGLTWGHLQPTWNVSTPRREFGRMVSYLPRVEGTPGPSDLSEGTMLDDKYRIERLLATGGMGAVYLGTHIQLRKRVAIKVLSPQHSTAQMIKRFHREAITASQIGHEGIAQVTDIGTSREGELFFVMEYLEGESLASRLRSTGPLAIEDACELACSILSPLSAAHRAGIVHRDLKPDNVFLVRQTYGEMVKLLDFGISRASGLESEFRLTTTGIVLGTPYYMSPEQARGNSEISPAADLYALGVILYEMLTGRVPIEADNYNQLMYRVMIGEFERPRGRRPDLPENLEAIIVHAMATEPEARPASATDLEQALLPFCRPVFREHVSGRMSVPRTPLLTPPPSTARRISNEIERAVVARDHTVLVDSQAPAPNGSQGAITPHERPSTVGPLRRSRWPWIAGAAVLCAGIAGAVVIAGRRDTPASVAPTSRATLPATHEAPGAGSTTPAEPPKLATPGAAAAAAPATSPAVVPATTITLRFAIEPAGAVILLDGAQIKASELVVPKDDAPHTLRITAPGYIGQDRSIRFDESQGLFVHLQRAPTRPVPVRGNDRRKPTPDPERIDSESPYK
jgi:serine/threonine protein kinase